MQSRIPMSHASLSFGDNWTQGCALMVRPVGAVRLDICLVRIESWHWWFSFCWCSATSLSNLVDVVLLGVEACVLVLVVCSEVLGSWVVVGGSVGFMVWVWVVGWDGGGCGLMGVGLGVSLGFVSMFMEGWVGVGGEWVEGAVGSCSWVTGVLGGMLRVFAGIRTLVVNGCTPLECFLVDCQW